MYYCHNPDFTGEPTGPFVAEQLQLMLKAGTITPAHWIAKDGDSDWVLIGTRIPDLNKDVAPKRPSLRVNERCISFKSYIWAFPLCVAAVCVLIVYLKLFNSRHVVTTGDFKALSLMQSPAREDASSRYLVSYDANRGALEHDMLSWGQNDFTLEGKCCAVYCIEAQLTAEILLAPGFIGGRDDDEVNRQKMVTMTIINYFRYGCMLLRLPSRGESLDNMKTLTELSSKPMPTSNIDLNTAVVKIRSMMNDESKRILWTSFENMNNSSKSYGLIVPDKSEVERVVGK